MELDRSFVVLNGPSDCLASPPTGRSLDSALPRFTVSHLPSLPRPFIRSLAPILCSALSLASTVVCCGAGRAASDRPPVVPYWAFGHWIWEDEVHTRDAVEHIVSGYRLHDIPVAAVLFDSPWCESYTDFVWDPEHYPRAQDMIDDLHARGIRVVVFYTGALNRESNDTRKQKCDTYDFVLEQGFAINGGRESKWWKGPAIHVDFTNPRAVEWWRTQVAAIHGMRVDGAKIDAPFARFGKTVETSIGPISNREFGRHYFEREFEFHTARNPDFVAMTYAWSGLGLIGYPSLCHVNWVGDFQGDWQGMQDQRRQIYKSAQDGFSAIACEIGGFWKVPSTKEQFIRYAQLSCFMPVMINGGQLGALEHHLPWKHDAETVALYRELVLIHTDLAPYLFSTAVEVNARGGTILRVVDAERGSHLLGPDLFVQTVTTEADTATVTLPAGDRWVDLWTDAVHDGGATIERACEGGQYPVYVRAGAIVPVVGRSRVFRAAGIDASPDSVTLAIYPGGESRLTYHRPIGAGIAHRTIDIAVDAGAGTIRLGSEREEEFVLLVKCAKAPTAVRGADAWAYDAEQHVVRVACRGAECDLVIEGLTPLEPAARP
jgi:alpha-glucosidase (family GH31 glycosyl hydrolase)